MAGLLELNLARISLLKKTKLPSGTIIVALLLSMSAILGALWLEFVEGYLPCELCYKGRTSHYVGIPILLLVATLSVRSVKKVFLGVVIGLSVMIYSYGLAISAYHAGAEWKFWEGPTSCGAVNLAASTSVQNLLDNINNTKMVSCTEPALQFFGMSLAGFNTLICMAIIGLLVFYWFLKRRIS